MEVISIIVPIYNAEKYLDRCVSSIVNQTYRSLDIILVDDGSSDRSPSICDDWSAKDNRIKAVHKENGGVSSARNKGLASAEGNYILMVDSDDYLYEEMVEILYNALQMESADMAVCEFEKGTNEQFEFQYDSNIPNEHIDGEKALNRIYIDGDKALQYVAPWAKLYKRELFDSISYPNGKIFEDIYVTHQILYRCKNIVVVPQKLTYYYQHSDSIMNKKFHVGKLDYLEALNNRISFYKENNHVELSRIAYDEYLHALIWEYSRARDLLASKTVMQDITKRFRIAYKKGYASKRYPNETDRFLATFNLNPELIILYWRINGRIEHILGRRSYHG